MCPCSGRGPGSVEDGVVPEDTDGRRCRSTGRTASSSPCGGRVLHLSRDRVWRVCGGDMVTPRRGTAVSAFPVWGGAWVGLLRGGPGPAAPRRGRGARADHCPLGADTHPPPALRGQRCSQRAEHMWVLGLRPEPALLRSGLFETKCPHNGRPVEQLLCPSYPSGVARSLSAASLCSSFERTTQFSLL